ncbi:MAG TPA: zinc-ribbon domain-containing protein [Myxococcaceae bacterium]|nr:zinc-ribbon domain-containing protein [Myxococcaceae bacterium]
MQIACPNCHTRYALDDRLVPAGGAPVQCTRCGLVFTAQRGGDGPGAQGKSPAPSGTLPFGSAARTAGPIRTEAYGQSPPPSASTQVFGSGPAAAPTAPAPPAAGRTQVFGSGTSEAARTQVFGAGAPRAAAPAPPASNRTQIFGGAAGPGQPPEPPPSARTQVFGGTARPPPPPEPPPTMRTQVFGGAAAPGPTSAPPPAMRTAVFGGAAAQPPLEGLDLPPIPGDAPPAGGVPSLELPGVGPEPLPIPGAPPSRQRPDPAERALAAELRRRKRRAVWTMLGVVAVGVLSYAGWSWWTGRSAVPASIRTERDEAFARLRRDDPQSRAAALKVLDALVERYPQWVGARATQTLAQTLELDDQRVLLRRRLVDAEALKTTLARLEAERTPADWRTQADATRAKLEQLRKQTDPMVDAVNALEARLSAARDALNRLPPGNEDDERARLRADAVFAGVAGRADRAISDAERYRQLGGTDGWADVAYAEYVLSAKNAPPDSVEQAVRSMNDLMARDSTFIRPYVLAGRLLLTLRHKDAALSKLDAAVALNPKHVLAQALIDQERGGK